MKTEKLTSTFKMILVSSVFVVFTISLCGAQNTFECHYYDKSSKSLEIYCDRHQNQLPGNCTRESANPLIVTHLKIEGCDQRKIGDASEKYPNIESLNISHSGYRLLDWTGKRFERLTTFDASGNELTDVPTSILSKFPQLHELRLDGNKIEKICNGDFDNVNPKLATISLSNNGLKSIDDDAFASFEMLLRVDLSHNQFSTFPKAVFTSNIDEVFLLENAQLTTINCADLLIRTKPANRIHFTWELITAFNGRCNLNWRIDFENREFDKFIRNSMDHTTFYCNFTKPCFENMRYFAAGPRTFISDGNLLRLLGPLIEKIDVNGKPMNHLDASAFERFHNLSELRLCHTALDSFDFSMLSHQRQLSYLDISQNHLNSIAIPKYLQTFTQLTHLNASGSMLKDLDEIVRNLPSSVRHLALAENELAHVSNITVFNQLRNLEELDLHDISSITDGNSHDLDLAYLPSSLKRLNLHGTNLNQIKYLDRKHFPVLTDLDVSNNALDCDYLDELQEEFEDIDTFKSDKCKRKSIGFWTIFLAVFAISIILIIIIIEQVHKFRKPRRY